MKIEQFSNSNNEPPRRPPLIQPLVFAGILILGIFIGTNLHDRNIFSLAPRGESSSKIVSIINEIENHYVDSITKRELVDDAIASILSNLDPHSYYISPEELAALSEPLEGEFDGIGVEFIIQSDTLMVVKTVAGGPSEGAGIIPGDRIIEVDDVQISGKDLNSEKAIKLLKGKRGTKVKVTVKRRNRSEPIEFNLTRDAIPLESISASFIVKEDIGYIKIERFAKTTYDEFMEASIRLKENGVKKIILDLRGNGGGYMDPATDMIQEFLTSNKLIVYTEGVHQPRNETRSSRNGKFMEMELVVMIDQGSASASEIVAGALQDWDRSVTVGRRSFGKGLVQHEIPLADHSALRLTVARYYTPTGRCIQKPYGDSVVYADDFHERFISGELLSADSIDFPDSLKFKTPGGRFVYGGGGIMPDVFVPLDTVLLSATLAELSYSGLIRDFAFNYADSHRAGLLQSTKSAEQFLQQFKITPSIWSEFNTFLNTQHFTLNEDTISMIEVEIKNRIKAQVGKNLYDDNLMQKIYLEQDKDFNTALKVLSNYSSYTVNMH